MIFLCSVVRSDLDSNPELSERQDTNPDPTNKFRIQTTDTKAEKKNHGLRYINQSLNVE